MENTIKYAVLGGGSWATAIVKMLSENLSTIYWYMHNERAIEHIQTYKHNPNYLSSVELHTEKLHLTSDINQAVAQADYLIFVIPSAFLADELKKLSISLSDKIVFSAIKGIVPQTGQIVGDFLMEYYQVPSAQIGVITGPCHAEEVALERLSYLTVACTHLDTAATMAEVLSGSFIRTHISKDIIGVEYGAMLKNIYAIAAGIAHGLGYGDNFQAVLMSNAIREMKRYVDAIYPLERDINQSAYLGDLLVTGYSLFSRNRTFGNMIGKGYSVKSAFMEMSMVAEGYYAVENAFKINQGQPSPAYTPILDAVYGVLYGKKQVRTTFLKLTELMD
ncbi:NAD(P)H-dependent glycerol-3-phosphate dehydrogenase [uncultured Capnocytophaga sp.]|uniref:NAD(P)H-dependent glycerol-3-phosphate dehydrogenase n=1 Tax=uncultured Capnocytophaga sp. TaxID=159273 RepID=UPI0026083498|nr:NAD(P)H-dependent glycerol-3-phosphate dehydrogenase [uncultured Capnocytophaga sp.]